MYYNQNTGNFRCGEAGSWQNCIGGLLSSNTAASTTLNGLTATAQNFSVTSSIPANYCVTGRVITIRAVGILTTTTTAQPVKFAVLLGATQVGGTSLATTPGSSVTNRGWGLEFTIICDAAPSASSAVNGEGWMYVPSAGGAQTNDPENDMPFVATNIATNAAQTINISVTLSGTASASNTITLEQLIVTGM
jgi:hypothetical protein